MRQESLQAIYDLERQFGRPVTKTEIIQDVLPATLSESTVDVYLESWTRSELIKLVGDGYRLGIRGQHMLTEARNSRHPRRKH